VPAKNTARDCATGAIEGQRVPEVMVHPAFKPVVDLKARMYDMGQAVPSAEIMSYREPDLANAAAPNAVLDG
jgi:4-hydroxyphenylacetate 3-monooxygenase